jgi:CRISPR/Cas system CSM-associated protein Csm3 (group 7 of RAMP superfamily)
MNKFKFTAVFMSNTLPFQVTPHLAQRVMTDNPYLPFAARGRKDAPVELVKEKLMPRAAWRNGVPVIPATTFKGAIRHILSEYMTRGMNNLDLKMFNYLALGGIKPKGSPEVANSPNNRKQERDRFPLVSLFGSSHPMFIRGAIKTFPDVMPKNVFMLDEVPIMRTDPTVRDEATIRCDPAQLDRFVSEQSDSSSKVKKAEKKALDAYKALETARDKGDAANVPKLEAALVKARADYAAADEESVVQTGQLHTFHVIPAGQEFTHEFRLEAEDHEIGLLLLGLREFAINGGIMGGQISRGAGCGLDFTYQVEMLNDDGEFEEIGTISNDTIDESLGVYVKAFQARASEFHDTIVSEK